MVAIPVSSLGLLGTGTAGPGIVNNWLPSVGTQTASMYIEYPYESVPPSGIGCSVLGRHGPSPKHAGAAFASGLESHGMVLWRATTTSLARVASSAVACSREMVLILVRGTDSFAIWRLA